MIFKNSSQNFWKISFGFGLWSYEIYKLFRSFRSLVKLYSFLNTDLAYFSWLLYSFLFHFFKNFWFFVPYLLPILYHIFWLLLIWRNAIDFYMLILNLTLQDSPICSHDFSVYSLEYPRYRVIISANTDSLIHLFPVLTLHNVFLNCLRHHTQFWTIMVRMVSLSCFWYLGEKQQIFKILHTIINIKNNRMSFITSNLFLQL